MGTWNTGAFDNDDAQDWLEELLEGDSHGLVSQTLDAVLSEEDYLEADLGSTGLAASEVIASLYGRPKAAMESNERLVAWGTEHAQSIDAALVAKALSAIDRVRGPDSELVELWEGNADWTAELDDLRSRLSPSAK